MKSIPANEIFQKVDARQIGLMTAFVLKEDAETEVANLTRQLTKARAEIEAKLVSIKSERDNLRMALDNIDGDTRYAALRSKLSRLVKAANWALNYMRGDLEPHAYCTTKYINSIKELKAAIEAAKGDK